MPETEKLQEIGAMENCTRRLGVIMGSTHGFYKYHVMDPDPFVAINTFQKCCEVWECYLRFCYVFGKVYGLNFVLKANITALAVFFDEMYELAGKNEVDNVLVRLRVDMMAISKRITDHVKKISAQINNSNRGLRFDATNLTELKKQIENMSRIKGVKKVRDRNYARGEIPIVDVLVDSEDGNIIYGDGADITESSTQVIASIAGARMVRCYDALIDMCEHEKLDMMSDQTQQTQQAIDFNCKVVRQVLEKELSNG